MKDYPLPHVPACTQADEYGYLHNHPLPGGRLDRYRSLCAGCDRREEERP